MSQEEFDRDEEKLRALFDRTAAEATSEEVHAIARRAANVPIVRVRRARWAPIFGALLGMAAGGAAVALMMRPSLHRDERAPVAALGSSESARAWGGPGADDSDAAADSADDDADSQASLDDLSTDDPKPEQAIALQQMLDER